MCSHTHTHTHTIIRQNLWNQSNHHQVHFYKHNANANGQLESEITFRIEFIIHTHIDMNYTRNKQTTNIFEWALNEMTRWPIYEFCLFLCVGVEISRTQSDFDQTSWSQHILKQKMRQRNRQFKGRDKMNEIWNVDNEHIHIYRPE